MLFIYLISPISLINNNSTQFSWRHGKPCVIFTNCLPEIESNPFTVLPQHDGKLPVWQMAVAATALFNTVQNFLTLRFTTRLYNNVPATQPGVSSTSFTTAELALTRHLSDFVTSPYIRDLDVNCLCSAPVCRLQYPQQSVMSIVIIPPRHC